MKTFIKFCGCTNEADAIAAVDAGADAVGLIFAPSQRRIGEATARDVARVLPPGVVPVGVFVDPSLEDVARVRDIFEHLVVQLSGHEPAAFVAALDCRVIKAVGVDRRSESTAALRARISAFPSACILFDTQVNGRFGGTGQTFAWEALAPIAQEQPILVGGGLTPANVATCVRSIRPFGVDVRSGVESGARKDHAKMRAFVRAVRQADEG